MGVAVASCGKSAPAPPTVTPPPTGETITGSERLGWDQRAGDNAELSAIRYAVYVDGARSELAGVTCAATPTATGFACTARLPPMTAGAHTIEMASFVQDGSTLESARSAALRVTVAGVMAPEESRSRPTGSVRSAPAAWSAAVERIADGLDRPADLAIAPDGRAFVAERGGRIRIVERRQLRAEPAIVFDRTSGDGEILALAIDPEFDRSRFVYAIYTAREESGALTFTLARFRESGNTLGDRIVLLDDVKTSAEPKASLRFGSDRKLYAIFDDGGDERLAADAASFNGKLLRLNTDGTTPDDQPRGTPIVSAGYSSPRGIAWHRATLRRWDADRARVGSLRWALPPTAIAIDGDGLFVSSETGLLRAGLDARAPGGVSGTVRVLGGEPVTAVATSPEGRVYFTTSSALGVVTASYK